MAKSKTVRTNKAYKLDSPIEAIAIAFRVGRWVVRHAWRFRTELGYLTVLLVAYFGIRHEIGPRWATWNVLAGIALLAAWARSRRLLIGRLCCSTTRRRLQQVFTETKITTASGKVPLVVRSKVTAAGERYWLWLRIGHSAELLDSRMEEIRAAARCRDVRVIRNEDRAHRVLLEVTRRDPLAGMVIDSPLVRYAADLDQTRAESRAMPTVDSPTPDGGEF